MEIPSLYAVDSTTGFTNHYLAIQKQLTIQKFNHTIYFCLKFKRTSHSQTYYYTVNKGFYIK